MITVYVMHARSWCSIATSAQRYARTNLSCANHSAEDITATRKEAKRTKPRREMVAVKEAAGPDIDKKAAAAERQAKDHKQAAEPGQGERSGQVRGRSRAAPRRAAKRKRKKQARADDATVERKREEAARAMPTDPRDRQQ